VVTFILLIIAWKSGGVQRGLDTRRWNTPRTIGSQSKETIDRAIVPWKPRTNDVQRFQNSDALEQTDRAPSVDDT